MQSKLNLCLALVCGMAIGGSGVYFYNSRKVSEVPRTAPIGRHFDTFYDSFFNDPYFTDMETKLDQGEDSEFVYYKIPLDEVDKDTLKVDVKDGHVSVSGKKSEVKDGLESYQSFQRVFPVPEGVEESKVSFETKDDEFVIKFLKTS